MYKAKKNEARFTIKFNPANPRHREAMRMLNEAGRCKASLIADALSLYDCYGATACSDLHTCGDLYNGRNSKRIATKARHEVVEVENATLQPHGNQETYKALDDKLFNEGGFWKDIESSVGSFFD